MWLNYKTTGWQNTQNAVQKAMVLRKKFRSVHTREASRELRDYVGLVVIQLSDPCTVMGNPGMLEIL